MRTILITLLAFATQLSQAQLSKVEIRLGLYNGEVINGSQLQYESPSLKDAKFLMDSEEYETSEVQYFQNTHGYFANLNKLHGDNAERYAMRIRIGKLNLYEEVDISVYGSGELATDEANEGQSQDPMLASGETFEYYNKDEESVRIANYNNLCFDLSDNEKSMKHLKKYRNYRLLQWTMLSLGSGVVAFEVIRNSGSAVRLNPFMAFGFVLGGSSYFMESPKRDELWLAADVYNEEPPAVTQTAK
ncbi:MAG: hypothetical protein ACKVOR_04660 [Flavobacteriales bacterium]